MAPPSEHGGGVPLQDEVPLQGEVLLRGEAIMIGEFAVARTKTWTRLPEHARSYLAGDDEGDVILACHAPYFDEISEGVELIVSGKLLSEASPLFKKVLEVAPSPRSAADPQILVFDWRKCGGLSLLCHVLAGQGEFFDLEKRDWQGSLNLLTFAQAAKEWEMVEYLKPVISPGLLAPFAQRSTEHRTERRDGKSFRAATDLVTIAYLLEQEQMFELFTRRLIMDHGNPFSHCAPELFEAVPAKAILSLADQRAANQRYINDLLVKAASHYCEAEKCRVIDRALVNAIGPKLDPPVIVWPPSYGKDHTIREVLAVISSHQAYRARGPICCDSDTSLTSPETVRKSCKAVVDKVDQRIVGLCFTCVKENRAQIFDCKHRDTKLYEKDPIA